MSIRVRRKRNPAITANSTVASPSFGASADVFRGNFIPLVHDGNVKTGTYMADNMGPFDVDIGINKSTAIAGPDQIFSVATGGGAYGDDCLKITLAEYAATFSAGQQNVTCTGHPFVNAQMVFVNARYGDTMPGGMPSMVDWRNAIACIVVDANTLRLVDTEAGFTAFTDDGGDLVANKVGHGLSAGHPIAWYGTVPSTLTTEQVYYVLAAGLTTDSFKCSTTPGGAPVAYAAYGAASTQMARVDPTDGITFSTAGTGQFWITRTNKVAFFMIPYTHNGVSLSTLTTGSLRYMGRKTAGPYNTFEYRVKAPANYRSDWITVSQQTNATINIGTYSANDADSDFESHNYHFYYEIRLRHDTAAGDWITVKIKETPNNQRSATTYNYSTTQDQCTNGIPLIANEGRIMDTFTRCYHYETPYNIASEMTGPYDYMFDRMRIYYEQPKYDIVMSWDALDTSVFVNLTNGQLYSFPFTITNNESYTIDGNVIAVVLAALSPVIKDSLGNPVSSTQTITLPASGTWTGTMEVQHAVSSTVGTNCGIDFRPLTEDTEDGLGNHPNITDPKCEGPASRTISYVHNFDGSLYGLPVQFSLLGP